MTVMKHIFSFITNNKTYTIGQMKFFKRTGLYVPILESKMDVYSIIITPTQWFGINSKEPAKLVLLSATDLKSDFKYKYMGEIKEISIVTE